MSPTLALFGALSLVDIFAILLFSLFSPLKLTVLKHPYTALVLLLWLPWSYGPSSRVTRSNTMGQQIGKATFDEAARPFANLSASALNALWTQFNLSAEAWGLRLPAFTALCLPLAPFLGADPPTAAKLGAALFTLLDTDVNGLVDALEFLSALAMISAMEPTDKVIALRDGFNPRDVCGPQHVSLSLADPFRLLGL